MSEGNSPIEATPNPQPQEGLRIGRRELLKAAVALAVGRRVYKKVKDYKGSEKNVAQGDFLKIVDNEKGEVEISVADSPQAAKVNFVTAYEHPHIPEGYNTIDIVGVQNNNKVQIPVKEDGLVPLFRDPNLESEHFYPEEIAPAYAAPVLGEPVSAVTNNEMIGVGLKMPQLVKVGDEVYGVWHVLVDKDGKYVDLKGNTLPEGEKPYYIPSVFVEPVTPSADAPTRTSP
jgi:hypothetical protein